VFFLLLNSKPDTIRTKLLVEITNSLVLFLVLC
jgi:hypothetical protein